MIGGALRYSLDDRISAEDFRDVLVRSTLAERRPVDQPACLRGMLEHADILATCWDGDVLAGVARSVTDFSYCCYLSDLAVDVRYQRRGAGRRLIDLTQSRLGPLCQLILLSAPSATEFYPKAGFTQHPRAFVR